MNEASKTWKILTDEERSWFAGSVLERPNNAVVSPLSFIMGLDGFGCRIGAGG